MPLSKIRIATIIPDQDLEAKVVTTAIANNWVVVKRAIDAHDLEFNEITHLFTTQINNFPNFHGKIIVLTGIETAEEISKSLLMPEAPSVSKLMLRQGLGKNFAVVGIGGGVGASTIAINLAFELADRNLMTHLGDYSTEPMVAPYLGLRDLIRVPNKIHSNLIISQTNFTDLENYFHFLQLQIDSGTNSIFDFGSTRNNFLDFTNLFVARLDLASLNKIILRLNRNQIPEGSWLILNQRHNSNFHKSLEGIMMQKLEGSPFKAVRILPSDTKAVEAAQSTYSALIECASGSALRRAIKELARELVK